MASSLSRKLIEPCASKTWKAWSLKILSLTIPLDDISLGPSRGTGKGDRHRLSMDTHACSTVGTSFYLLPCHKLNTLRLGISAKSFWVPPPPKWMNILLDTAAQNTVLTLAASIPTGSKNTKTSKLFYTPTTDSTFNSALISKPHIWLLKALNGWDSPVWQIFSAMFLLVLLAALLPTRHRLYVGVAFT